MVVHVSNMKGFMDLLKPEFTVLVQNPKNKMTLNILWTMWSSERRSFLTNIHSLSRFCATRNLDVKVYVSSQILSLPF